MKKGRPPPNNSWSDRENLYHTRGRETVPVMENAMTDKEKAIVMAHTGICMLTEEKFHIFHEYIEKICGRPIWTHELASACVADEIKEKSREDFLKLCRDEAIE